MYTYKIRGCWPAYLSIYLSCSIHINVYPEYVTKVDPVVRCPFCTLYNWFGLVWFGFFV